MNKEGFMSSLEGLLADIPTAEREEALQYYNDYFEDAGWENEESVIRSLGSPRKIAENIKAELKGEELPEKAKAGDHAVVKYGQIVPVGEGISEEKALGAQDHKRENLNASGAGQNDSVVGEYGNASEKYDSGAYRSVEYVDSAKKLENSGQGWKNLPVWAIILIICLAVIVLPGAVGILTGIVGALAGILAAWFGLILCGGAVGVGLIATAIALSVIAFLCLVASPAVFALIFGVGLLCGSGGLIAMALTGWLAGSATPAIFKGVGRFLHFCARKIRKLWRKYF